MGGRPVRVAPIEGSGPVPGAEALLAQVTSWAGTGGILTAVIDLADGAGVLGGDPALLGAGSGA
ncbi:MULTISPECIES: hypothetical protein [unclassified Streptomyces]|uniref:hypothetical protein n=1 Tax=unclassified Streptomyces TaxID=2593676 RepID=UPI00225C1BCF|nr:MULTISPECIES: hypothetical protein [unclassified Streptomyces]MCX4400628.1 hypothetical protein [Streptomyces sp. NBC_01764]MCX5184738.1 hypothetical protein [Streptomyces sp. NBC_00268]